MATSSDQYTPVFLPGEYPWQRNLADHSPQVHKELDITEASRVDRCKTLFFFFFFACGNSAPVRVKPEGGGAALVTGTLVVPSVQGHGLSQGRSYGLIRVFFRTSGSWWWVGLSTVNSSPHTGIAPQSLCYSSQPLLAPGNLHPCPGYIWLWQGLSDSHSI